MVIPAEIRGEHERSKNFKSAGEAPLGKGGVQERERAVARL